MDLGQNPFNIHGYTALEDFCDRKVETSTLVNAMLNNRNVTLFSLRRMGKSGLLYHLGHHLVTHYKVKFLYSDIFNSYNNEDLAKILGQEVMRVFAPKRSFGKWLGKVFKSFVPKIAFDPLTGNPELSFDFNHPQEPIKTIENIFLFLRNTKEKIVWAIDEFQQIGFYDKAGTEALLRTQIQQTHNVSFVFSGSHRSMLTHMFNHAKRPFYQSTQWMELHEIPKKEYQKFILKKMNVKSNKIGNEEIAEILEFTLCHTWYVQFFCNRLYAKKRKVTLKLIQEEKLKMLNEFEPVYHNFKALLSALQWQVLRAVAKEERLYSPTAFEFLYKYKLGAAASVKRALQALIAQDMVSVIQDDFKGYYRLNDVFLMRWFQRGN